MRVFVMEVDWEVVYIAPDKIKYQENIFLFLHENIHCGYSLEALR